MGVDRGMHPYETIPDVAPWLFLMHELYGLVKNVVSHSVLNNKSDL
jgi:hypothetical protein